MTSTTLTYPLRGAWRRGGILRGIAGFIAIALLTAVVLGGAGASWDLFVFLLACAVFVGLLVLARPLSGSTLAGDRKAVLQAALVIWMFLMVSEGIFAHPGTTEGAVEGKFDPTVYYQAASWVFCFFALAFITYFRPAYVRLLFSGRLKWASIFAVVAVFSCPLSPKPAYSLALAFKLCVIVLTLFAISETLDDEAGVSKLFAWLMIGTLIRTIAGFVSPFLGPDPAFVDGRLGSPTGLSGTAGILLLLSVLFLWLKKSPWFLLTGAFSVVVMMMAGIKGGIVASFLSFVMFFALLKRAGQALVACIVFTLVFVLFVAFTPLGQSLQHYGQSGNVSTLTGRTNLWAATWPEIESHPIFGHGYRASRFVSAEVEGAFAEAGNMHNSFLEVLYNNGLAGLIPILIMNFIIVANLVPVIKRPSTSNVRLYAAAAFALYLHLLLWGMTAPTFGGMPDNRFMTFFAVLLISVYLKAQSDKNQRAPIYGHHVS
jgi:O-antigen ligase